MKIFTLRKSPLAGGWIGFMIKTKFQCAWCAANIKHSNVQHNFFPVSSHHRHFFTVLPHRAKQQGHEITLFHFDKLSSVSYGILFLGMSRSAEDLLKQKAWRSPSQPVKKLKTLGRNISKQLTLQGSMAFKLPSFGLLEHPKRSSVFQAAAVLHDVEEQEKMSLIGWDWKEVMLEFRVFKKARKGFWLM